MIWREICANVLLADCNIIVFFNKVRIEPPPVSTHLTLVCSNLKQKDILQKTLETGTMVSRYVPSYGDQPNDVPHVTKCRYCPRTCNRLNLTHLRCSQTLKTVLKRITLVSFTRLARRTELMDYFSETSVTEA